MNKKKIDILLKERIYKFYDLESIEALATDEVYNVILQCIELFDEHCDRADNDIFNTMIQKRFALMEKRLRVYFESTLNIYRELQLSKVEKITNNSKCLCGILRGGITKYQQVIEKYKEITNKEEEELIIAVEKERYLKIFEYKDISKLATNMDYEVVRFNGDHAIYKHKITNNIVTIPVRTIGSGLSYQIQKQLRIYSKN